MSAEPQERKPIPWIWLGIGLVLTVLACIAALLVLNAFLSQAQPAPAESAQPTIIILTAPPSPTSDPERGQLSPTPIPTFTPIPTPDAAVAPPEITIGFFAVVANTDGLGVTVRGGPSTRNVALTIAEEGAVLLVVSGPEEGDGFNWWQVRLADDTEGWAVNDFLEPAAAP